MSEREGSQRERGARRAGGPELARAGLSEERALTGGPVAVVGAGTMGGGIATLALGYGLPVVLVDVDAAALAAAQARIDRQLRHAHLLAALPADRDQGTLTTTTAVADVTGAAAVVEAVTEDPARKREALAGAAAVVPPGTPLISTTSGIPIGELADALPRPEDLLGTHFMNPSYLIDMVELVRGPRTGDAAFAAARALLAALGRRSVVVRDAPGFVTSRLLHAMINDAARIVDEGVATADEVDALMQGCLGHRTGPLRTADLIGLDNLVDSLRALHQRTGEERYRPADALLRKVAAGELGHKSGRGFHDYGRAAS
jgi:methoxymalonate biosynthesis protein